MAQVGDKKEKNAAEKSRWYLLHPEDDPAERMRRGFEESRGDYKRKYFDRDELRRRRNHENHDTNADFAASMYDDAPSATAAISNDRPVRGDLFDRVSHQHTSQRRRRNRSASPGARRNSDEISLSSDSESGHRTRGNSYRNRSPPPYSRHDPAPVPKANLGKELFSSSTPDLLSNSSRHTRKEGGLHSDSMQVDRERTRALADDRSAANAAIARKLKKELFWGPI